MQVCAPTIKPVCACVQVEKEVVKAIRQMEEVDVEVKKKKEVSSRVKQLRRQVSVTCAVQHDPVCLVQLGNGDRVITHHSL